MCVISLKKEYVDCYSFVNFVFYIFYFHKNMLEQDEMQLRSSVSYDVRYSLYDKISLIHLLCVNQYLTMYHLFAATRTALSIQHNFTVLLEELPDQAIHIMKHVLTHSERSDIKQFKSVFHRKAKLLKIILRNRDYACKELFKTISLYFRRDDLIQAMKTKSARMIRRGMVLLFKIHLLLFFFLRFV